MYILYYNVYLIYVYIYIVDSERFYSSLLKPIFIKFMYFLKIFSHFTYISPFPLPPLHHSSTSSTPQREYDFPRLINKV